MKSRKIIIFSICAALIAMIGCGVKSNMNNAKNTDENGVYEGTDNIADDNPKVESERKDAETTDLTGALNSDKAMNTDQDKDTVQDQDTDKDTDSDADSEKVSNTGEGETAKVDVDLTSMSSILVYSEVYNMVYYPERYVGKTVRMKGINSVYRDEVSGKTYFACFIMDATACCSQGIEYQLKEEYKVPDDYPKDGADVCVEGVFDTYYEDDYLYCVLRDAVLAE